MTERLGFLQLHLDGGCSARCEIGACEWSGTYAGLSEAEEAFRAHVATCDHGASE